MDRTILGMLVVAVVFILLLATYGEGKNLEEPYGLSKTEGNFKYVLTCIENKNFVAYQTSYEYWELAGPVGECK